MSLDAVTELANKQLELTRQFSDDLYDEIIGISEGSATSPSDIVLINNYSNLGDVVAGRYYRFSKQVVTLQCGLEKSPSGSTKGDLRVKF